ncbi:MAG: CBS domain-containing protein [Desulfobacterales bacterium]|nr:CBS domain-containing protein [Desulfobacterales bacterium]
MITIQEIMTRDVITVSPQTEITEAARLLLEKRINGVPVLDASGKLVGILCQSDLIAQQKKFPLPSVFTFLDGFIPLTSAKNIESAVAKIAATTVEKAMTPDPVFVRPDTSIEAAAALMVDRNYHTLPVVEKGKLIGVVGKEDILRTLLPIQSKADPV